MLLRDKSSQVIKDSSQLVLLDIRQQADHEISRVFKAQWFNLPEFIAMETSSADFK
jgi:hypothetical protein